MVMETKFFFGGKEVSGTWETEPKDPTDLRFVVGRIRYPANLIFNTADEAAAAYARNAEAVDRQIAAHKKARSL